MAYSGFMQLGDVEIINSERAVQHSLNGVCARGFEIVQDDSWGQTHVWRGEDEYVAPRDTGAPWVEDGVDASLEFGGVWGMNVTGLDTLEVDQPIVDSFGDGGYVGYRRFPPRVVNCEVLLTAQSSRGLQWGLRWLTRSLADDRCDGSGEPRELTFLAHVPEFRRWETNFDVQERASAAVRQLTRVVMTKAPEVKEYSGHSILNGDSGSCTALVEFELTALVPRVWRSPVSLLNSYALSRGERLTTRFVEPGAGGECPGVCDDDSGVLTDPAQGDLWTLPRPVAPGAALGCDPLESRRSVITIAEGLVPLTGEMLPTVVVRAGGRDERNLRIRWVRGLVVDDSNVDCESVGEAMVTYLPAGGVLELDGQTGLAWASLPDGTRVDATPVVVGRAGAPWRAPRLLCGSPYTLIVDAEPETEATIEASGVTGEL